MNNLEIEKIKYAKYKDGLFDNLDADTLLSMQVLELLEQSGYSLDMVGTYLFRDMIVRVSKHLNGEDTHRKMLENRELIKELSNPYSQFYADLARNDLDMGINLFHEYLEDAQANVDSQKYDIPESIKRIVHELPDEINYGSAAFLAGAYISKKINPVASSEREYKRTRIKNVRTKEVTDE